MPNSREWFDVTFSRGQIKNKKKRFEIYFSRVKQIKLNQLALTKRVR